MRQPVSVEKTLKSGVFLECPNKKKTARKRCAPKKRGKKGAAAPQRRSKVVCTYSKRIGDAPPPPTAETHGPVVEKKEEKRGAAAGVKETGTREQGTEKASNTNE